MLNPALSLGELYMDGAADRNQRRALRPARVGRTQHRQLQGAPWIKALDKARVGVSPPAPAQRPPARQAQHRASHYDLDERLYGLFLDSDRQYSCAYFEYPGKSLDDAQTAKNATLPPSSCREWRDGARHRLRVWRPWALPRARRWRACNRGYLLESSSQSRPSGRVRRAWPIRSNFNCRIIAMSARLSTASSRLACSSTSASIGTTSSSPKSEVCSRTMG